MRATLKERYALVDLLKIKVKELSPPGSIPRFTFRIEEAFSRDGADDVLEYLRTQKALSKLRNHGPGNICGVVRLPPRKLRIVECVRLFVFGNDAGYLRFRVELNWILLAVIAVIVLALVEGKVGLPVDLWPTLIGKGNDTMDIVDNPVAEVKGKFTNMESTCQEECDLVVECAPVRYSQFAPAADIFFGQTLTKWPVEPEQISRNRIERVHEFEVTQHEEILLSATPARRRAQQRI